MSVATKIAGLLEKFELGEIDRLVLQRALVRLAGEAYDEGYARGVEDTDYNWEMGV